MSLISDTLGELSANRGNKASQQPLRGRFEASIRSCTFSRPEALSSHFLRLSATLQTQPRPIRKQTMDELLGIDLDDAPTVRTAVVNGMPHRRD